MQYNSYLFIFTFLPVFLLIYYSACKIKTELCKYVLIGSGLVFYYFSGIQPFLVLLISIIINYGLSLAIEKWKEKNKYTLVVAILLNVSLLLFYKYVPLVASSSPFALSNDSFLLDLKIPLGISFFTFQQIMYIVSIYTGKITKNNFADYLSYVLFFPKLIMGPLIEPIEIIPQINDPALKKIKIENIAIGIKLFSYGLFKKVVLADTFMKGADWGFDSIESASSLDLMLVALYYTFEIYFDFSGYIDMATGISKMINIDLPMNFNSPYKSISIRDFWKRWHITLTEFFTHYIYYPLGGNRKGKIRTYINILIVFLLSGIWHGSHWTFVLWGAIHGLIQIIERIFDKQLTKIFKPIRWIYTFVLVNVLWLLFRADSISQWKYYLFRIVSSKCFYLSEGLVDSFILPETPFLFRLFHLTFSGGFYKQLSILTFTVIGFLICMIPGNNYKNQKKLNGLNMILAALAFAWSLLCLGTESVFIYNNF